MTSIWYKDVLDYRALGSELDFTMLSATCGAEFSRNPYHTNADELMQV
jgi:hypothetical protein